ncbi:neurotrophin-7 [Hoplias malabaricus]|uniref:neurotrophin-7 n=1 Tax=Hoplias malabaricus TaxID=27720 RepID=UPI003462B896
MRSSTLVLFFLISVRAAYSTELRPQQHPKQQQRQQQPQPPANQNAGTGRSGLDDLIPVVDPKLFNKRRFRSARVVFSAVAPPPGDPMAMMIEEEMLPPGGPRVRRGVPEFLHRGEYSVCDSENRWVGNLTRATDVAGNEVTVLPDVRINDVVKRQFFYETTCRTNRPSGTPRGRGASGIKPGTSGCRGIDNKHWNSYCTNTHTYVRALTSFRNQVAWRLIRINAACVCVLSRKSWKH